MKIHLFLLVFLALAVIATACPSEQEFTLELKKGLFNYLQNPQASKLTLYEVKDLLEFYLSEDIGSQDCSSVLGSESGMKISTILEKTGAIPITTVPMCSDGTIYGQCSKTRPKFCYSGLLRHMCYGPDEIFGNGDDCGCPDFENCEQDGTCSMSEINCFSDESCGTSTFVGEAFCMDGDIYQKYLHFFCVNPKTSQSYCSYENQTLLIKECSIGCTEGYCI